jgi:hypothetical protein
MFDNTHVAKVFIETTDIIKLLRTTGRRVFVPSNWEGIKGVPPLKLKWKPTLPSSMKPRARPINPKLYQRAKKEFDRSSKYFYESPIASCLIIAPKATTPFIRLCGDYVAINYHIEIGHYYPIPHVQQSLEKIITFMIFLELDWVNSSFHQVKLDRETSKRLFYQAPCGQFQPKFMPEGIGPASGILQMYVSGIFSDFSDWIIAIFDNRYLLVLAYDFEDVYRKCELILNRCIERNVFLKFSKTWLGFPEAKFFWIFMYAWIT